MAGFNFVDTKRDPAPAKSDEESSDSQEDDRKKQEISDGGSSVRSVHSRHSSVAMEYPDYTEEELQKLIQKRKQAAAKLQTRFRSISTFRNYKSLKRALDSTSEVLVARHFKRILFRREYSQLENWIDYLVSFRLQKRANRVVHQGSDMVALPVEPILKIYLKCNQNFQLNCEAEVDIERSLIDKSPESLREKLSPGGLAVICNNLLQNIYIVSHQVYFHANMPSMVNSEIEIAGPQPVEELEDDNLSLDVSPIKRVVQEVITLDEHLQDPLLLRFLDKLVFQEVPNKKIESVIRIQRFFRQIFRRQLSTVLNPRDIDEEIMQSKGEDHSGLYMQGRMRDDVRRKILYNCISKEKDRYFHMSCLINKKSQKRGEVHAYDFTSRTRLQPLYLDENVLFTTDLSLPEVFSKIDLDFEKHKVTVTQFNQFQIKTRRYLRLLADLQGKNLPKLIKIQAYIRGRIQQRKYARLIVAVRREKDIANYVKILTRFYISFEGDHFLIMVGKKKHDPKIILTAFRKSFNSHYRGQINQLELHSQSFKDVFQIDSDGAEKDKSKVAATKGRSDPENLLEYIQTLKGRVGLQPLGQDGLSFSLGSHPIDRILKVRNGAEVQREEFENKAKANQIDIYYDKKYKHYMERIMRGQVRAAEMQSAVVETSRRGAQMTAAQYLEGLNDKIISPPVPVEELVSAELLQQDKDDPYILADEQSVRKMIVAKYSRTTFIRRVEFSKTIRGDMLREKRSKQGKVQEAEESRGPLSDTSTLEYLADSEVEVLDEIVPVALFFDVRYNDIVYNYSRNDEKVTKSCALADLGITTRDVEDLKEILLEKASSELVWSPDTEEIVPASSHVMRQPKSVQDKPSARTPRQEQDSAAREHTDQSRDLHERPAADATSVSDDEASFLDPKTMLEKLKVVKYKMRTHSIIKKLKCLNKIHVESCKASRKLISKSFFIADTGESFTLSVSFSTQQYAFEIAAYSWEVDNRIVAAKLDIEVFCRLFGIKRLPDFGPSSSSIKLREIFSNDLNEVLSRVKIELDAKKNTMRLNLDWESKTQLQLAEKASKELTTSAAMTPAPSGMLPALTKETLSQTSSRVQLLVPISGQSVATRPTIARQKYVYKPVFHNKMSPSEMGSIYLKSVIKIQSFFRRLWVQSRVESLSRVSKLPAIKVKQVFKKFDQYTASMSIVYEKLAKFFRLYVTLQEGDHPAQFFTTGVGLDPLIQECYGNEGRSMIDTQSKLFYRSLLPELACTLADRIEFFKTVESEGRFICEMKFKMPFNLSLEPLKRQLIYVKEEEDQRPIQPLDLVLKMAIKLQRFCRKFLYFRSPASTLKNVRRRFDQASSLGKIVLLTFKKISGVFYQVWVYEKSEDAESHYNFVIIPKERLEDASNQTCRISYRLSEHKLLNSRGLQLLDYLLEVLRRREQDDGRAERFYFDIPKGPSLVKATRIPVTTGYVEEVDDSRDEEDASHDEGFDNYDTYAKVTYC